MAKTKNTDEGELTNDAEKATDEYLRSLGVDPAAIPRASGEPVVSMRHQPFDPMAWQGEAYERLSPSYEFYRASKAERGKSVEIAQREGYVVLPGDHDARMVDCSDENDVIMIRDRQRGDEERARRAAVRRRLNSPSKWTNDEGVTMGGTRERVPVRVHAE